MWFYWASPPLYHGTKAHNRALSVNLATRSRRVALSVIMLKCFDSSVSIGTICRYSN